MQYFVPPKIKLMTSILVSIYIIFCYITDSMDMNISKLQEMVKERGTWWATVHGVTKRHDLVTEKQHIILHGNY